MIQFRNVVFCLLQYERKMMNELEYDKREIVSLIVFQCVKFSVQLSSGSTVEFLQGVRQDLSDVCVKAHQDKL